MGCAAREPARRGGEGRAGAGPVPREDAEPAGSPDEPVGCFGLRPSAAWKPSSL